MAFNKSKALESALKYLNQGKVAQAIAEYQQILRNDPKDQATLMTVGDLFARQGDMPQAIEYFERLAEIYLNDGFNSKAIAIYRKIAKLAPAELVPLERLADLYIQQGVLSEARPLFLQIAEAHLKANHASKAVEVLHRLLDVEPENPRVQLRLAELYNVMGQKKEAAQTYLDYAQRLFGRGETEEAVKLVERALEVDPGNPAALLLKGKSLTAADKDAQAIAVLKTHPEADAGAEITTLLLDLELKSGHPENAAERARKQLQRGHEHFGLLYKVGEALVETGKAREALPLLRELRAPMIEASEQDKFLKLLSSAADHLPNDIEPLEMLADFCRYTSDSFRLSDMLSKLSDAYAASGNFQRAEELLLELIDRNKDDERLVARLNELRARSSGGAQAAQEMTTTLPAPVFETELAETPKEAAPANEPAAEEVFDEETERYIAQALTDVDLFSSYGLTQKATHLLENVLERAPRHTPTLERLLDLYLGAGNDRRTAELAAQLEQIHRERNDNVNADRFAELRQRFQKVAGLTSDQLPSAPPAAPAAPPEVAAPPTVEAPPPEVTQAPQVVSEPPPPVHAEFEIPVAPLEAEPATPPEPIPPEPPAAAPAPPEPQPVMASEEVDLSDEWEAMSREVIEPREPAKEEVPPEQAPEVPEHAEVASEPQPVAATQEPEAEPEVIEIQDTGEEPSIELIEEPAVETVAPAAQTRDFEIELTPESTTVESKPGVTTSEDFLSDLVAEIDDLVAPAAEPAAATAAEEPAEGVPEIVAAAPETVGTPPPVPEPSVGDLNQLAEVFQEFRSELDELGEEEEDLETHYNLGIAYREMGLLDEAIGEFQKVAKAVQNGKPFSYAMNCATLLALSFMDKGEPKIASLWYQRALEVPGLEHESLLALHYDLGVAQEMAGESEAALENFRQVYAMNIDYRDVAERIAMLQKR
jgi:tetratricopeptide (TPR) repeat protein